jgi:hypothetical protein
VLLIWEYGNWKAITGSVDLRENSFNTMRREVQEEVGVTLDGQFTPRYIGGWQKACARDKAINDAFMVYAVRASSKDVVLKTDEVGNAHWFDVRYLVDAYHAAGSPAPGKAIPLVESESDGHIAKLKELGQDRIATNTLNWVTSYYNGNSLKIHQSEDAGNPASAKTFIGAP